MVSTMRPAQYPPTLDDLAAIGREALATIPDELRRHVGAIPILVEEFPDDQTEIDMDLETPFDLLGLYRGVALSRKSVLDISTDMDMIFLYRRPILDYWCETGENIVDVVRHVLIHEIGHHFGLSDEDMERLEDEVPEE